MYSLEKRNYDVVSANDALKELVRIIAPPFEESAAA